MALFAVILLSGGSLAIPRIPLLVLVILLCLNIGHWKLTMNRALMPVLALLGIILAAALARPSTVSAGDLVVRYANFLGAFLLLNLYMDKGHDRLATDMRPILKFMAIQAIITIILANTVPFLFVPIPAGGGRQYTLLLLFNHHVMRTHEFARPDGFFWEPGVLQIYLNLYLYISLFVFKSRREGALALAGVAAALSTTGLIVALMMLFASFGKTIHAATLRRKVTIVSAALIIIVPASIFAYNNAMDKFTGASRGSFLARQFDLMTGVNVVLAHPILGIGFGTDNYSRAARESGWDNAEFSDWSAVDRSGNTNGIIYLLYSVGIPLSVPFLLGLYRQRFFKNRLLIWVLLVLSLMSEPIILTPFPLLLAFDGIAAPFRSRVTLARKESLA